MMPEGVEWPRGINGEKPEEGEVPLHFLAQVCCEDLPADLWDGHGPRTGWLLFFINPNNCGADIDEEKRVLHIAELGEEREPPFDTGRVHDGVYTGGGYSWLPREEVPDRWRRWPVDIVAMPNELTRHEGEYRTYFIASPDDFSDILYADVPTSFEGLDCPFPELRPLTFGQARQSVQALALEMQQKPNPPVHGKAREMLLEDGGHARLMEEMEATRERVLSVDPGERADNQKRRLVFIEEAIAEYGPRDPEDLLRDIEARHEEWLGWRENIAKGCAQIDTMLGKSDPDAALSEDHWQQLKATFAGKHFDRLELHHSRFSEAAFPVFFIEQREEIELKAPRGMDQIAIETHLDPAKRHLLPDGYAASQEEQWRKLTDNRPHRMGGFHDGVQSEPSESPPGQMLLMQIASDDAMDWCWGDIGAYYFWIRPDHLDALDFSGVDVFLECG